MECIKWMYKFNGKKEIIEYTDLYLLGAYCFLNEDEFVQLLKSESIYFLNVKNNEIKNKLLSVINEYYQFANTAGQNLLFRHSFLETSYYIIYYAIFCDEFSKLINRSIKKSKPFRIELDHNTIHIYFKNEQIYKINTLKKYTRGGLSIMSIFWENLREEIEETIKNGDMATYDELMDMY